MPRSRTTLGLALAALTGIALALPARGRPHTPGGAGKSTRASTQAASPKQRLQQLEAELQRVEKRTTHARRQRRQLLETWVRMQRAGMLPWSQGIDGLLRHAARLKRLERATASTHASVRELQRRRQTLEAEQKTTRKQLQEAQKTARIRRAATASARNQQKTRDDDAFYGLRYAEEPRKPRRPSTEPSKHLTLPIRAPTDVRDARRAESHGPGLEFRATRGSSVHAAEAGRVAFADRYGSYGRMVMLDHGESLYTVYGGLEEIHVRVGDELSRRATLGRLGGNPSTLFFEVRRGSRAVSPRPWLPELEAR